MRKINFRILGALNSEERGLFKERIKFLDKKIHPGLTKLTWSGKGHTTEYFVNECRTHAGKVKTKQTVLMGILLDLNTYKMKYK